MRRRARCKLSVRLFPRARRCLAAALGACAVAGVAACGSSPGSPTARSPASPEAGSAAAKASGTADVAYAGSLASLNEKVVGPAFTKATGVAYQGRGAGSDALSQEIRSGEITPNVFESVGSKPITALEPKFTRWYIQFAGSPLVVAYNPGSRYARQLNAIADGTKPVKDLFTLMEAPGFKLGRTDPNVDPQGAAFIEMLELAQAQYGLPPGTVTKILGGPPSSSTSPQIFDETALEPRLQAGQLDAASAFLSQAVQLHLHYIRLPAAISLGDPAEAARYATASVKLANGTVETGKPLVLDITTVGSTDKAAADAFVAYVLSKPGLALHKMAGYTLLTPTAFGDKAAIPAGIRQELGKQP
ncbi:MAG TPA: extracellular solute-binding protein [Streptosporangiaceae bacterium]|nr:extracellular solute-binding protein [Streptosporangiaceae bacterium]